MGTIGRALAECFAVAGAKLVLTYNRTEPSANLKDRCTKLGASAISFVKCDVSDLESCSSLVDEVHTLFLWLMMPIANVMC